MFKRSLFFAALMVCFNSFGNAQSNCFERFDGHGIYLRNELWKGLTFVKNGQSKPVGFAYKKLAPEFEKSRAALPLFKKSQRNARLVTGFAVATLLGAFGGALLANQQIDKNGAYALNEHKYQQGIHLIIGSSVIGATATMVFHMKSRRQLDDALWLRNRELFDH